MRHTESGMSMPGVIASGAIHAVIIGALIYGVRATTNDVVPPTVVGTGFSIRRDRDTTGTWQGVLSGPSGATQIVLRISDGPVKCVAEAWGLDDVEPNRSSRTGAVTLKDSALRIEFPSTRVHFAGTVTADATEIRGTWEIPWAGAHVLVLRRADGNAAQRDLGWCR